MSILGFSAIFGPIVGAVVVSAVLNRLAERNQPAEDPSPARKRYVKHGAAEGALEEMERREARRGTSSPPRASMAEPHPPADAHPYDEDPGLDVAPPGFVLADYSGRGAD